MIPFGTSCMLKIAFPMRKVVFPKNGPKKEEGFQKKGRGWNWINKELLKEFSDRNS